jgi:hypothetical protein
MPGLTTNVIGSIWIACLLATGLIAVGACAGWSLARNSTAPPVRAVRWWVQRVVLPLLHRRSWFVRSVGIFANNIAILTLLTVLGRWHVAALIGVAAVGVNLGIGLRVLGDEFPGFEGSDNAAHEGRDWRVRFGMALNMLELPAIMLTGGLALQRVTLSLSIVEVWGTFLLWILPATMVAGAGESLWIGVCVPTPPATAPPNDGSSQPEDDSSS